MSDGMNKVILMGNLGNDPELREYASGSNIRFRLATSESWRDRVTGDRRTRTEWHNVTMWGARADALAKILHKGDQIAVVGRLETRSYEVEGVTKYFTEVKAEDVCLTARRQSANARSGELATAAA